MKKKLALCLLSAMLLGLCACGAKASTAGEKPAVTVDYGTSAIYSREDMDAAMALIREEFSTWDGCELHSLRYASDECGSEENIAWMNELQPGRSYAQCIEFLSSFHSPKEQSGAWEPDTEYTDWQWWLARPEGGDWELLSWGY